MQRQLNQYSLMAQIGVSAKANLQNNTLPENCLLHCEFCNFDSGHLSSIRRHYLNRHGRKMLRCKDCDFFTGIRYATDTMTILKRILLEYEILCFHFGITL